MKNFLQYLGCLLFAFVYLIVSSTAIAQFNLPDTIPFDQEVVTGKLPNGLTYYIRKNPQPTGKVELRLVVNAGSVLENPGSRDLHILWNI